MKSPEMNQFVDNLAKSIYGRSRTHSVNAGSCVKCGGEALEFKDEISKKEFNISGFCQKCQDEIFGS